LPLVAFPFSCACFPSFFCGWFGLGCCLFLPACAAVWSKCPLLLSLLHSKCASSFSKSPSSFSSEIRCTCGKRRFSKSFASIATYPRSIDQTAPHATVPFFTCPRFRLALCPPPNGKSPLLKRPPPFVRCPSLTHFLILFFGTVFRFHAVFLLITRLFCFKHLFAEFFTSLLVFGVDRPFSLNVRLRTLLGHDPCAKGFRSVF